MNQNPPDHWRGPGGPPQGEPQPQARPYGSFGPNGPAQAPPHVLPPPASYHQHLAQPSGSHSLSIADLTQGPPNHQQHQYNTQPPPPPPPQAQGHGPMPPMGHPMPQHSPQYLGREREIRELREREMREHELREREMRERSNIELQRQRDEIMMREREREARERDQLERMHHEQHQQQRPVQSHAGSIPIHQPVASKVQNSIHGPNGLLANGGAGVVPNNGAAPSTGAGLFGTAAPHESQRPSQYMPQQVTAAPSQQPGQTFMPGPSPMTAPAQLAHGQQPILNDALSYLDQVKVRFSDHPDVYNRFLDIMKDFKSQAIDTPGVIERVSNLFNGHPALIQGFNTFLPPGYRIECGTEENPDAIRVTTPSGTMTQSLHNRGRTQFEPAPMSQLTQQQAGRQDPFESRHGWGQALGASPGTRPADLPGYKPASGDRPMDEGPNIMTQQEQRNVSTLQSAVTAVTNGMSRPALAVSPGPGQPGQYPQQAGAFGGNAALGELKRGGPVEFNHAISYVNKIKNRFAQQPEIYKQFLEILQTYQRESKPIQDVYAQVTQLFVSAPDLLEDFKQFLPESAAHGKAQAARAMAQEEQTSNVRGEPGYATGAMPQAQTPRPASKMPPLGQFDPPSTSKESKKRRGGPGANLSNQPTAQQSVEANLPQSNRAGPVQVGNANKRPKLANQRQPLTEAVVTSPTLVPALPEPLPPFPNPSTTQEELGFFDRAKKQIGNRASYAEFLKLINLYTQDLIDKYTLADRVGSFIGNSPELMNWFKNFLGIEEQDEIIEARARPDPGRVNLSHCRALGPSYRHLPKREQNKPCKGRDGMCYEVLNDVWASHPTWASEDSGFVAHRKNQYEEALHRIEEERHDYDFHIECCQRTIQLMEPIVQQIGVMSEADRAAFVLAPGLGGSSEAIPKRIIMKVYGREVGGRVMQEMFARPTAVLPIVLSRLKQKLEEWKHVQREWEKVWRDQIHKHFWKSLDHQGINAKNLDKKNFQQKTLTSEIQAKYEEAKKNRESGIPAKRHQLEYKFDDLDVIADAARLILVSLESERVQYNTSEQDKLRGWLVDFVVHFFGLDPEKFQEQIDTDSLRNREHEEGADLQESDTQAPTRGKSGPKANWLRRLALERRHGKEDSVASASKESTPMPGAMSEMDLDEDAVSSETPEQSQRPWIKVGNSDASARQPSMDEPYPHTTFNLYANANIYCFFRLFQTMYIRLLAIKQNEANVEEAVARYRGNSRGVKPAIELRMIDKGPEYFFYSLDGKQSYYSQILQMCEEVLIGTGDMSHLEETLRRYYNKSGWQLYTIERLVGAILRFIMNILAGDVKDKSIDITNLFMKDRERPDTTRKQEIQYRKQVERLSKDGEVYRISYTPEDHVCTIRLFPSEDATFDSDALSEEARWQYYVASYTMTDPTEGVDQSRMRHPFLRRNIAPQNANVESAYEDVYGELEHYDEQTAFISPESYKVFLQKDFCFNRPKALEKPSAKGYEVGKIEESEKFREKFVRNTAWMKDQRAEDVERKKAAWERGVKEGFSALGA
ncbi:Transcriptional regulatory protein sin3 [Exophiala dermatitidis]|nr:Transcriptional regulatory protein sin3 [Exophiala dermatitidis]KAJ4670001.1 Transcriptional regulatory protein sin3 [Exophiala dermatitidis]KAJ4691993.1 Transcriptional regulatory protein sin3 [Exophiala dermatitidis]